jgi:hypothetical protein
VTNQEREKICNAIVAVVVDGLWTSPEALKAFVSEVVIGGLSAGCDDDWPLDAKEDDEILELWEEYGYRDEYEKLTRRNKAGSRA